MEVSLRKEQWNIELELMTSWNTWSEMIRWAS